MGKRRSTVRARSQYDRHNPTYSYSYSVPRTILTVRSFPDPFEPLQPFSTDMRLYLPDRTIRPPGGSPRAPARLRVSRPLWPGQLPTGVRFAEPQKLDLCKRREIRRRVLHAKGVAGSKGIRKYRRNEWSNVSC